MGMRRTTVRLRQVRGYLARLGFRHGGGQGGHQMWSRGGQRVALPHGEGEMTMVVARGLARSLGWPSLSRFVAAVREGKS